jgi:hypothetical protein
MLDEMVQTVESVCFTVNCSSFSKNLRNLLDGWVVSVGVHEDEVLGHQNSDDVSPVLVEDGDSTETLAIDRLHHFSVKFSLKVKHETLVFIVDQISILLNGLVLQVNNCLQDGMLSVFHTLVFSHHINLLFKFVLAKHFSIFSS